uniref:Uncharacterized protein n=1 Tax=Lygus hesperus TaxID=30085 RepID=A0A0A9XWF7_LYGHE
MKVVTKKKTGVVKVTLINNHVGHTEEVGGLNLTKVERAEIADEHADTLWNALLPVIPTIKAASLTEHSNFVPASGQVKMFFRKCLPRKTLTRRKLDAPSLKTPY